MKTLILLMGMCAVAHGYVFKTRDINDVARVLAQCDPQDVVFIDVDDTIQTVKASLFAVEKDQNSSQGARFLDQMKKDRAHIPNCEKIISQWRMMRAVQLVHSLWSELIRKCKCRCYALTQLDSGPFGIIERTEKWRYQELEKLGIKFTPEYGGKEERVLLRYQGEPSQAGLVTPAVFYRGIFMTGAFSKGEVVKSFLTHQGSDSKREKTTRIVFIDDREEHVANVGKVCQDFGVPFVGIVYRGVECVKRTQLDRALLQKIMDYQKNSILNGTWAEDEEAMRCITP